MMKRGRLIAGVVLLVMAAVVFFSDQSSDSTPIAIALVGLGITLIVLALRR
ncbi:MAG: hypothetical protein KAJ53_04380 [Anaerolineales bacterium]|nr:hypothetical protein [Anaerolineales bacterium]